MTDQCLTLLWFLADTIKCWEQCSTCGPKKHLDPLIRCTGRDHVHVTRLYIADVSSKTRLQCFHMRFILLHVKLSSLDSLRHSKRFKHLDKHIWLKPIQHSYFNLTNPYTNTRKRFDCSRFNSIIFDVTIHACEWNKMNTRFLRNKQLPRVSANWSISINTTYHTWKQFQTF